jgi:hypothetical protein
MHFTDKFLAHLTKSHGELFPALDADVNLLSNHWNNIDLDCNGPSVAFILKYI